MSLLEKMITLILPLSLAIASCGDSTVLLNRSDLNRSCSNKGLVKNDPYTNLASVHKAGFSENKVNVARTAIYTISNNLDSDLILDGGIPNYDAGSERDGGIDAGMWYDAGQLDASIPDGSVITPDGGSVIYDAGEERDAGMDAGMRYDAGQLDASIPDGGIITPDAGSVIYDGGSEGDGGMDAGILYDAGPSCIEIQGFDDEDNDGVGAGQIRTYCTLDGQLPLRTSTQNDDCDPRDSLVHTWLHGYANDDEDPYTADTRERRCTNGNYSTTFVEMPSPIPDCDNSDPEKGELQPRYLDADNDGVGAGEIERLCDVPDVARIGYSLINGDCNPNDERIIYSHYGYDDADEDGFTLEALAERCVIYSDSFREQRSEIIDCADNDSRRAELQIRYIDQDFDGHGVGLELNICDPPEEAREGYALNNTDCDPLNPTAHTLLNGYNNLDEDELTTPELIRQCTNGTYTLAFQEVRTALSDCDDTRADRTILRVRYVDGDGDSYGWSDSRELCVEDGFAPEGFSLNDLDCFDNDPNTFPGASEDLNANGGCDPEDLNGGDNNCDGIVDEHCMTRIPEGIFTMGCDAALYTDCTLDNIAHAVTITRAFMTDIFEVTNRQYTGCVEKGYCSTPLENGRNLDLDAHETHRARC